MDADKYLVLLRAYIKQRSELEALHAMISNAVDYLQSYKTSVSTSSGAEFSISKRYSADAALPSEGWPSLAELNQAVAVFEKSAKAVIDGYNSLPAEEKALVAPP